MINSPTEINPLISNVTKTPISQRLIVLLYCSSASFCCLQTLYKSTPNNTCLWSQSNNVQFCNHSEAAICPLQSFTVSTIAAQAVTTRAAACSHKIAFTHNNINCTCHCPTNYCSNIPCSVPPHSHSFIYPLGRIKQFIYLQYLRFSQRLC